MRLEFWTSFLSFFPNLTLSYLYDVADVGKRAENCVGTSTENLVDFDGNWVDGFEQCIDMKAVVLAAQDRLTSRKIWMIPPSRVVRLGVRIVSESGVGCIHTIREHLLSLVNRTLLK